MLEYHKELNPKLWMNNTLIPEVKNKLIEIYQTFVKKLKENEIPIDVIDVLLLGSNAGFNYHENSDIDLHIVVDFNELGLNNTLAQIFYNNEKSKFNEDYDINIKGLPVEVYIEDINAGTKSNGIYSLIQDKWLKFPEYNPPEEVDYSFLLNIYEQKISNALLSDSAEKIKEVLNEIKMLRKLSLMSDGEYSKGNLVFKELRNNGDIDRLYDKQHELISQELSLEHVTRFTEGFVSTIDKDFEDKELFKLSKFERKEIDKDLLVAYKKKYPTLKHLEPSDPIDDINTIGYFEKNNEKWPNIVAVLATEPKDDSIWITALEVMENYRGHGLSKQLLDEAIKLKATKLSVSKKNELAIKIYEDYGFKIIEDKNNMYFMEYDK